MKMRVSGRDAPNPGESVRAALGLGSNVGDRRAALRSAIRGLADASGCELVAVSRMIETEPVGGPPQPDYLNAVVIIQTILAPEILLELAKDLERRGGRIRSDLHWGPRPIDIDLLNVGDRILEDPALTLPHPRALDRGFVLIPWSEISPEMIIAGTGITVAEATAWWWSRTHTLTQ